MKTIVFFLIVIFSAPVIAGEYSAIIENLSVESDDEVYNLNAAIEYNLSPIAREALQKGISLTWIVIINVKQQGLLWDTTLKNIELTYQIQNHALLNLYSVNKPKDGTSEFFSTLAAAFNSIAKIRGLSVIDKSLLEPRQKYHIALKILFNREALPIPLRPVSYFDSQWALSSSWTLWQLQK